MYQVYYEGPGREKNEEVRTEKESEMGVRWEVDISRQSSRGLREHMRAERTETDTTSTVDITSKKGEG